MRFRSSVFVLALVVTAAAGWLSAQAPTFQAEVLWPKPLPNHWILGSITGVAVDAQDHIWIAHRGLDSLTARTEAGTGTNPPTAEDCCAPAPPVLEFDAAGTLLNKWGGPGTGFDWPVSPGGIAVDAKGNVWITAAGAPEALTSIVSPTAAAEAAASGGGGGAAGGGGGRRGAGGAGAAGAGAAGGGAAGGGAAGGGAAGGGAAGAAGAGGGGQGRGTGGGRGNAGPPRPADAHVLEFSSTGQFIRQIGKPGDAGDKDSQTQLDRPAAIAVDSATNEVFVADGGTHQRVVVFDANTGAFKRQWRDAQFAGLSAIAIGTVSGAKTVFVGDRKNNKVYAFKPDGTVVTSVAVRPETKGFGTIWGMTFAGGTLYVADGQNNKIWSLPNGSRVASSFGDGGGWPGRFRTVGSVAVDSKGNLYTGEAYEGKRIQKWVKK